MTIEHFTLRDNLMLAGDVLHSSGCLITFAAPAAERYTAPLDQALRAHGIRGTLDEIGWIAVREVSCAT